MPKRVVDGEGLWRSDKLSAVEPAHRRAEYANLIPLALANGTFEASPRRIWAAVYAYNRPDITPEETEAILVEFERVKLLFRWLEPDGKTWGYWLGIEKPGRLPGKSRRGHNEIVGPEPPLESLKRFMDANGIHKNPTGNQGEEKGSLGFGSGLGIGSCSGSQSTERDNAETSELSYEPDSTQDNFDVLIAQIGHEHPANGHLKGKPLSQALEQALAEAVARDGADLVLAGTRNLREAVAKWPKSESRFIPNAVRFYRDSEYLKDPNCWVKGKASTADKNAEWVARQGAAV